MEVAASGSPSRAGFYEASGPRLARIRAAMAATAAEPTWSRSSRCSRPAGWSLGGERLKTSPRGYDADHPRIEFLRHKSMTLAKLYGFEPFIHTPELLGRVRDDWREATPFVEWVCDHAGE